MSWTAIKCQVNFPGLHRNINLIKINGVHVIIHLSYTGYVVNLHHHLLVKNSQNGVYGLPLVVDERMTKLKVQTGRNVEMTFFFFK